MGQWLKGRFLVAWMAAMVPSVTQAAVCDIDGDGDIDQLDLSLISRARNQPASGPDDPRDANGDGVITPADVITCIPQCTWGGCNQNNTPPTADAGPDQTVFMDDVVTLDASGTTDIDGQPLTYE